MRPLVLIVFALVAVGCLRADVPNGALKCSADPSRLCPEGYFCAGNNTCWKTGSVPPFGATHPGDACTSDSQCGTEHCVDGVCCDSACFGQCQACDQGGGVCTTITGAPHGQRTPCGNAGYKACAGFCDGNDPYQCHYPNSTTPCGPQTCFGGVVHAATICDSAGGCIPASGMLEMPCPAPPNGTATCAGDQCDFSCNPPYQRVGSTCVMPGSGDMG